MEIKSEKKERRRKRFEDDETFLSLVCLGGRER